MCGIVGYLGLQSAVPPVMNGLSLLQNRGYDSVGISFIENGELSTVKYASTTTNNSILLVEDKLRETNPTSTLAVGHTRWATHGGKTDGNAHPHHDNSTRISIVHNGIIENFFILKTQLQERGYFFTSSTDTEVVAVLIGYYLDRGKTVAESIQQAVIELRGTWALVIIHKDYPDRLWAVRNGSPLLLGEDSDCIMVASEQTAFHSYVKQYISLNDNDIFEIRREHSHFVYNKSIQHYSQRPTIVDSETSSEPYPHWMLKEIMEQPDAVLRAINNGGRIESDTCVKLGGLEKYRNELTEVDHLILLGCGTSYHSGLFSLSLFKSMRTFTTVSLYDGADFSEEDVPLHGISAAVLISQSGETKDLQRCIQIIQDKGMISIGIVNTIDSFIARETNCGIYLNAGREVAVASTKSFTNQCVVLSLLAVWFSQNKKTCIEKRRRIIEDIHNLPFQMREVFQSSEAVRAVSHRLSQSNHVFILGKGKEEAVAKEGALKIKEITYIHAEGYSSSALKHGPFGLLEEGFPVVILDVQEKYRDKTENAYQEIKARDAYIIRISDGSTGDLHVAKNTTFGGILANVYLQWISYFCSLEKGYHPDYPRNLAKVVTVE
jgi:glucosamine--fructose-6-phosphate aminotransferase (isomerizing)